MKKRYRHKDGEKKEREPTDRERKDDSFPGYDDMKRLSHGMAEGDDDDRKGELFKQKWVDFATNKGIDPEKGADNLLDMNNDGFEEMRDVLMSIKDKHPDFINDVARLMAPLVRREGEASIPIGEGAASKDKVMKACNRHGFYSFSYFLRQLNLINASQKGNLK